ncbi:MAG: hypothetical protein EZS28_040320 [Streblomastix strix]|uniref:Uncharacterized protein n=1 Tax=Streblomastix strix TaxID=222440 RepID=A0A5J4U3D3_9EUKA|nr:MAG: hypothetical protein EZS28_040320 [Streblomastix strix]
MDKLDHQINCFERKIPRTILQTYAKALSTFVVDQATTSNLGRTSRKDRQSQDCQTSGTEWLDQLTYTPIIPINT